MIKHLLAAALLTATFGVAAHESPCDNMTITDADVTDAGQEVVYILANFHTTVEVEEGHEHVSGASWFSRDSVEKACGVDLSEWF